SGGWVSENWVTSSSPDAALNWWMNDWIHRVNILNPNWRDIGVGVGQDPNGGTIFVTDFTAGSNGEMPADVGPVDNDTVTAEPLSVPTGGIDYTIQPGDTLLAIAYRYGLDWVVIAESNKLSEDTLLQIGQTLHLPGVESVGGPVDETSDEQAEETVDAASTASDEASEPSANQTGNGFTRLYTVQPGNTLVDIAAIYDITWEELAAANNLNDNSTLAIGQELRIPGEIPVASSPATENKPASDNKAAAKDDAPAAETATDVPEFYELQEGDTIISVAVQYHLDWEDILSLNNIGDNTLLQLGQKIRLR
ncbi:MAG: LysM peptidoglycan-binding domain-containing protein, partial [Chloroflexi bacterium]|nr:LysM peptidoglycan-binding domain-containing protein [Chloroflexota bacterium]